MTEVEDQNQFARGEKYDRWVYDFRCPACGSCGELALPKVQRWMHCPEKCGARFVQWRPPGSDTMALRCINAESARTGIELARAYMKVNGSRCHD